MMRLNIKRLTCFMAALLIIFTAIFYPAKSVSADSYHDFLSLQNIWTYDKTANSCSGASSTGAGGVTSLQGDNNEQKIFNFLLAVGFTSNQAAGIMGSLQFEGGFSAFRQEESQNWPSGGYGIAQWTGSRRSYVTDSIATAVGPAMFNQYYSPEFGGGVEESNGFVPSNVPIDANDGFLLAELNYLYQQELLPSGSNPQVVSPSAASSLSSHFGVSVTPGQNVVDAIKAQSTPDAVAEIWTYSFEIPADIQNAATERAANANTILSAVGSAAGVSNGGSCSQSSNGPAAQKIVAAAQKEAADYASGAKQAGSSYLTYTNNVHTDWCAFFVTWILNEVGDPVNGTASIGLVSDLEAQLKSDTTHFTWHDAGSYTPQPGDIAIYSGHTNIVISATDASHVVTIGGNQGCGGANGSFEQTIVCQDDGNYWPTNSSEPIQGYASPSGG